jgi:hypothetical protein
MHQASVTVGQPAREPVKPESVVAAKKSIFVDYLLGLGHGGVCNP